MQNSVRFISIIPMFPGRADYLAQLVKERYHKSGIREYALSMPLHPQGDEVWDKIQIQAQLFRELKALLQGQPIQLGILFQTTLGHGGYWNMVPDCSLKAQRIVNAEGQETHRYCPYDPTFLAYIHRAVSMVVAEKPDFTLGDDDMRMFDHTCFCPHHLQEISRRLDKTYDRAALVAELVNAPSHAPVEQVFEEVQIDSMVKMAQTIRAAIDEVDPRISCGCCIVGRRADYALPETLALAGEQSQPFLRVNNGYYLENVAGNMAYKNLSTAYQVANFKPSGVQLLDESDTCPHNRFSKSARTMHLHITCGLLHGLDGGKLWFDQYIWPLRDVSYQYEEIVGKHQGFYATIHELAQVWQPCGVMTPIPGFEATPHPYKGMDFAEQPDWGAVVWGKMGIPVFYAKDDSTAIRALTGPQLAYFSDAEIRKMLQGKLIIDGEAAEILTRRGLAELLGVRAENQPVKGNVEQLETLGINVSFSAIDKTPYLQLLPGARELSKVGLSLYKGDPVKYVMPGSVYFRNKLGGEVITIACALSSWHRMMIENPGRRRHFISLIEQLGGYAVRLCAEQPAYLFAARLPDGAEILAVANYAYDPLSLDFAGVKPVEKVELLHADGQFVAQKFEQNNAILHTKLHLEAGEIALLKLTY